MKKVFLFGIIVVVLDFIVGYTLKHFYFKQESGLMYRTTYAIEKTNEDVLVFGSSRANHHYEPVVFEKELKRSFYNAGRDGSFILYHYAVLECVLKRYKPKLILLDISDREFIEDQGAYDRLSALLPYYSDHPEIRTLIDQKSTFENLKLLSRIYPYNSSLLTIAIGNTELNKKRKQDQKGYLPLFSKWLRPIDTIKYERSDELDSAKVRYYESFIAKCTAAGIDLKIINSPKFYILNTTDRTIEKAKAIASKLKIEFIDFSGDTNYLNHPELFADTYHLNQNGAKLFSEDLCKLLKN